MIMSQSIVRLYESSIHVLISRKICFDEFFSVYYEGHFTVLFFKHVSSDRSDWAEIYALRRPNGLW